MTHEEAQRHIEQIRSEKRKGDSSDLRAALKLLAEELNSKETHFILELLQNAEDNEYADKQPELGLTIVPDNPTGTPSADGCLIVLNNEVGFKVENVRSLCSVGQSTKKERNQGYIGEKGIGFKSVFRVTASPHIFSNGLQFRFQIPTETEGFGYILPHWVETVPQAVKEGFTAIFLPLQPGKREVITHQLSKIAPETVLFLKKLKRLRLGDTRSISCDGITPLVRLCSNDDESLYFVQSKSCQKPADFIEEKRKGVNIRDVTIAFPLKTATVCTGRIFAFLPTEFDTGLPFLVNADFILNFNRERVLEDRRWNEWLRDEISPTFVKTFLSVLNEPEWRSDACRFLPIESDLAPGSDFFAPIIASINAQLKTNQCILTDHGKLDLPEKVFHPGELARRVLRDVPRKRFNFSLLNLAWEPHWQERLEPLGVESLTFAHVFDVCNDEEWLKSRGVEWWETLLELCVKCDINAETVGSFPILLCQDGNRRPISSGVFFNSENQASQTGILSNWPPAHLLDGKLQKSIEQKPNIMAWLTKIACLRPFSVQSYITGKLLDWMHGQPGEQLIEATRFIAANLKRFDEQSQLTPMQRRLRGSHAKQKLRDKMPWLLADGQVLLPEARTGNDLVTPECLEGDAGWNLLFPAIDRHFFVIHDAYCSGLSAELLAELQEVFKACGATAFPAPRLRELSAGDPHYNEALSRCAHTVHGTPRLRDWAAPGWLLGLQSVEPTANGQRKIEALERWLKTLGADHTTKLLYCSRQDSSGDWEQISACSEFGATLQNKAWLHTSNGCVPPPTAYLDTPEFREFFGDSVPYVVTDIAPPLLEKLGVHVRLTANVLIGRLREMSVPENPDFALLTKIYRRLQDSTFDVSVFRREKLIFLSEPKPCWASTEKLVWEAPGALFDDDFGYVGLTYGTRELHSFFTEKLNIPVQPELRQYAVAWKSLCSGRADRAVVEKKLKIILQRLAESQAELAKCDWWREMKPHLHIWTDAGCFEPPAQVYVPDDFMAVELFSGLIRVAFPPKPNPTVAGFLRWVECRSLANNVQPRLAGTSGESVRSVSTYLTPSAKELCVLLVCSHRGWQDRCSLLQALLETEEVSVTTLTVEYSLHDNPSAGTQSRTREAHWDAVKHRLLLRDGVDPESLRDAACKNIAAAFFGEAEGAEMQAEFFRLLTVSVERGRKLMQERRNWRLNPEQQEWLRQRNWQVVITELDEVEQPPPARSPHEPKLPPPADTTTATLPVAANSQANSTVGEVSAAQKPGSTGTKAGPVPPERGKQEPPRSDTAGTSHDHASKTKSATETPDNLHDANSITADFVSVQAYTRSRPERPRNPQSEANSREAMSGLTTASPESKAALEQCGREFAARKLQGMGYTVTHMGQRSPGYDLLAKKLGDTLKVEVKAHSGEASSVFLTQREWEEHVRTRDVSGETWELWNVQNLSKSSGKNPTIQRVCHIPKSAKKESGYWIDLNKCSPEAPK
ncbi:MAG: hypothetical protein JWR26_3118 [Pedosphaera sp.]|nr:hypothetical protein [Pedosphaera sp.]